jgi:hypothetical protein
MSVCHHRVKFASKAKIKTSRFLTFDGRYQIRNAVKPGAPLYGNFGGESNAGDV